MTAEVQPVTRVLGRSGAGSRNHCVHGQNSVVVEDVLDVRAPDYFTVRHTPRGAPLSMLITFQFTATKDHGAHLRVAFVAETPPAMRLLAKLICHAFLRFQILQRWKLETIDALIDYSDPREPSHE